MKKMSRVAGILTKENSLLISEKSVRKLMCTLLTIITCMTFMSFSYANTVANSIDTNSNITKNSQKNFPGNSDLMRGKYRKIVHVTLPGTKAVLTADRELFAPFAEEWKAVSINMANFTRKMAVADREMIHNFTLTSLHPIANNSEVADQDMIRFFIEACVANSIVPNNLVADAADEALIEEFLKEHLSIGFAGFNSVDALISDSEMMDIFEQENHVTITLSTNSITEDGNAEVISKPCR